MIMSMTHIKIEWDTGHILSMLDNGHNYIVRIIAKYWCR